MKMQDLLSIERIIPHLNARDRRHALSKLAAHVIGDEGLSTEIVHSVLDAAELPVFDPGAGVSVPHAFVRGLREPMLTFARLDPAIDFGPVGASNTDLVALLLSPMESVGDHLCALACIARTLRDADVRNLLRAAENRDSIYEILCDSEAQGWTREGGPGGESVWQ